MIIVISILSALFIAVLIRLYMLVRTLLRRVSDLESYVAYVNTKEANKCE